MQSAIAKSRAKARPAKRAHIAKDEEVSQVMVSLLCTLRLYCFLPAMDPGMQIQIRISSLFQSIMPLQLCLKLDEGEQANLGGVGGGRPVTEVIIAVFCTAS